MDGADRRAYRAWLRTHHPDLGGDPEAFEAGLRSWRARLDPAGAAPVTVYRRPRGPIAWLRWHLARRRTRRERRRHLN